MDLPTGYPGLLLRNPPAVSASPLAQTAAGVQRLAAAGVGAVAQHRPGRLPRRDQGSHPGPRRPLSPPGR